jgi:hypothetical protein
MTSRFKYNKFRLNLFCGDVAVFPFYLSFESRQLRIMTVFRPNFRDPKKNRGKIYPVNKSFFDTFVKDKSQNYNILKLNIINK